MNKPYQRSATRIYYQNRIQMIEMQSQVMSFSFQSAFFFIVMIYLKPFTPTYISNSIRHLKWLEIISCHAFISKSESAFVVHYILLWACKFTSLTLGN